MAVAKKKYYDFFSPKNLLWTAIYLIIILLTIASINHKLNSGLNQVYVDIKGIEGSKDLVNRTNILEKLKGYQGYDIKMANIEELDLMAFELLLEKSKLIKNAEVYLNAKNQLFINIEQNEPIVRILSEEQKSYYLDKQGNFMPCSANTTIRVPVASGFIPLFQKQYLTKANNGLKDIYTVAKQVYDDAFLSALIEQIYLDEKGEIILVPKIGRGKILIGEAVNLEDKFENLKIFYRNGLPVEGWNKFKYLNLKWDDQVVGET